MACSTNTMENFPSHISINGMELMERVLAQVQNLGVVVDEAAEIERLDLARSPKSHQVHGDAAYTGKAIILATGRQPIRVASDTDCDCIHYCSVCDGSAYVEKETLRVVGGGNSGFDKSLYLLSLGVKEILMVEALERCCATESTIRAGCAATPASTSETATCVVGVAKEGTGSRVTPANRLLETTESVYVDGLFVFIGQKANTRLFTGLVDLDPNGYIVTGPNRETNLRGVYAAGDVG